MKIDRRNLITSKQLSILIISAMTGVGIISLPGRLAEQVGHNGWISILLSGSLAILMAAIIIKLLKRYKDKSIFEINLILYGRYMGTAINILYLSYLAFKVSINVRIVLEIIHTVVLKQTPPLILAPLILASTIYITWCGLKPVCRYATLVYVTIFLVILLFLLNIRYIRLTFLMPVIDTDISSILSSVGVASYSFLAFAFPWVVYPMVTDKERALKYTIGALLFSTAFFLAVVVVTTGFFGENMLKHMEFPLYSLARSYKAPVVERIDLFFLAIWFPAMGMSTKAYFFVTNYWIDRLFKIKKRTLSLFVFTISIIALSRLASDNVQIYAFQWAADAVGAPLILFMAITGHILSLFKGKEARNG